MPEICMDLIKIIVAVGVPCAIGLFISAWAQREHYRELCRREGLVTDALYRQAKSQDKIERLRTKIDMLQNTEPTIHITCINSTAPFEDFEITYDLEVKDDENLDRNGLPLAGKNGSETSLFGNQTTAGVCREVQERDSFK